MRVGTIRCLTSIVSLVTAVTVAADEKSSGWPQWRGPNRDAVSTDTGLLRRWRGDQPELVWKASGAGAGYSSVVVADGSVFTMGKQEGDVFIIAFDDATGKTRWTQNFDHTKRSATGSTPTLDGDRLYALAPDGGLVCMKTTNGTVIWHKRLIEDFGGVMTRRGYCESPLIDGEKLICTPGGPEATIVALDKLSGDLIWQTAVPQLGERGYDGAGYASIVMTTVGGIRQYVQLFGRGVCGVAAEDGRFLWGYNRIANDIANIPTPIVRDDVVFCATGYGAGSAALRLIPDGKGGIDAQETYTLNGGTFQNHHGGMVLVGDYVYGGHGNNNGLPTCIELKTGKVLWKSRGPGSGSAAIVYADGHLYCRYQDGVMALIQASTKGYKLKGTFKIPSAGADSWAHPVVTGGRLYLREQNDLLVYNLVDRQR